MVCRCVGGDVKFMFHLHPIECARQTASNTALSVIILIVITTDITTDTSSLIVDNIVQHHQRANFRWGGIQPDVMCRVGVGVADVVDVVRHSLS